jgi:hypothetical protein
MSSPKVKYREQNLSAYVPSDDGITVAIVIPALRGKVGVPVLGGSRKQFLANFTANGKVEVGYPTSYFSALTILEATGNLLVIRAAAEDAKYSAATFGDTSESLVGGTLDPDTVDLTSKSFMLASANQGAWGNDLRVTVHGYKTDEQVTIGADGSIASSQVWGKGYPVKFVGAKLPAELSADTVYYVVPGIDKVNIAETLANAVAGIPVTVSLAEDATVNCKMVPAVQYTKLPGTMLISVYHKDNLNTPLQTYVVSKTPGSKDNDGYPLYIEDVLKGSTYINAYDNVLVTSSYIKDVVVPLALTGGSNGATVTDADMVRALNVLRNSNEYPVKLIVDGGRTTPAFHNAMISLCEDRMDCVPILSAPLTAQSGDNPAQSVVNYRKYDANFNTSFGSLYAPHQKILDEFNGRELWVSPDGVVAKAIIQTAANFEIWYPVGGDTRGVVNTLDTYVHFGEAESDLLYDNGINPIIFEAGQGIKIWGQKTLLSTPSMLDRLNVRLLLVTIGPAIKRLLKSFLFEFNDEATRAVAKAKVDAYMSNVLARRGVTRFLTICDTTNNTPDDIDNHRLVLDLLVTPNNSVEDIPFTVGIVNNSVSFELAQQQL